MDITLYLQFNLNIFPTKNVRDATVILWAGMFIVHSKNIPRGKLWKHGIKVPIPLNFRILPIFLLKTGAIINNVARLKLPKVLFDVSFSSQKLAKFGDCTNIYLPIIHNGTATAGLLIELPTKFRGSSHNIWSPPEVGMLVSSSTDGQFW